MNVASTSTHSTHSVSFFFSFFFPLSRMYNQLDPIRLIFSLFGSRFKKQYTLIHSRIFGSSIQYTYFPISVVLSLISLERISDVVRTRYGYPFLFFSFFLSFFLPSLRVRISSLHVSLSRA